VTGSGEHFEHGRRIGEGLVLSLEAPPGGEGERLERIIREMIRPPRRRVRRWLKLWLGPRHGR
jgi:hypothetical protein